MQRIYRISGTGLGLRRPHLGALLEAIPDDIKFFEVAPENWLGVGGRLGEALERISAQRPLLCHGLLLNLGGPDPLDFAAIDAIKAFLDQHQALIYGDHLSFCAADGQLYELLPMPFTGEAVRHVAARIRVVQDRLERRIAVKNPAYYLRLSDEFDELSFINAVLEEADCDLLLDINNIYVNSVNHDYDPRVFRADLPMERITYGHAAGHSQDPRGLLIDSHGTAIIEPVWELLAFAYRRFGVFPTLLERDENIAHMASVLPELQTIAAMQQRLAVVGDGLAA